MRRLTRNPLTVGAALAVLAAVAVAGLGATFQQVPPTIGLYRATAYTLRGGEWQIGLASILVPLAVSVEYGITNNIQVGTVPLLLIFGQVYAGGKLRVGLGSGLDLGIPFGFGIYADPLGLFWNTGLVVSVQAGQLVTLHGGVTVGAMQQVYVSPYAIVDLGLSPNLKLVGEVGFLPLSGGVGLLLRLLGFLEIRAGLMMPLWFHAGVVARF